MLILFNILFINNLSQKYYFSSLCRTLCFFVIICVSLNSHAAENYNQGALYFSQGDYATAISIWAPLAKQANPAAQYSMGLLYDQGKGVNKDPQLALDYFHSAAEQNLPAAQYYLGMKYFAGLNVKKDLFKANQLLKKAAQADHLQAQFQLANLYDRESGSSANLELATYWFTKAAENGFGPAQHSLATRFLTGRGTTLDLERGIFWLTKAAEQNDYDAMRDLGFMYFKGMGVEKNFQQAHDLLVTPAEEGSGLALFLLGEIYASGGNGIARDLPQAKKWYRQAVKSGYKDAAIRLQQTASIATKKQSIATGQKPRQQASLSTDRTPDRTLDNTTTNDNLRFKQLNDAAYVLQLLSARQYKSITQVTDRYIDSSSYILTSHNSQKPLYILLYGAYPTYADAQKAIPQLPPVFKLKSKPWIRQVKHIKSLIP